MNPCQPKPRETLLSNSTCSQSSRDQRSQPRSFLNRNDPKPLVVEEPTAISKQVGLQSLLDGAKYFFAVAGRHSSKFVVRKDLKPLLQTTLAAIEFRRPIEVCRISHSKTMRFK